MRTRALTKRILSQLRHDRRTMALVLFAVIITLFNSAIFLTMNLVLYMFQYDVGKESQYSIYMGISGVFQLLAMMVFYPKLRKSMTNRRIFLLACLSALAGYGIFMALIFANKLTIGMLLVPGILVSMANGAAYVLTTIFVAGAVDYGEKRTGRRENSVISSLQTLMVKLSSAFAVFIAGIGIDLAHLNENAAVQTADTITRMRILFSVPPFILMLGTIMMFLHRKEIGE